MILRSVPDWTLRPRGELDASAWDALVDSSDEGWLWHRHGFQDLLTTWPARTDLSFAVGDGDRPALVVPVHLVRRPLRLGSALRRLDSLGGPCIADDLDRRARREVTALAVEHLGTLLQKTRSIDLVATLPPLAPAWRRPVVRVNPLLELGFEDASGQTWVVDLQQPEGDLWRAVQGRKRTQVRQAERLGVTVREAGPDDLDAYYRLHVETMARTGLGPHPFAYFAGVWLDALPYGRATAWLAEHKGSPVAGLVVACDKGAASYWLGASSSRGRELHANDLLQWRAILDARERGLVAYESGEAKLGASGKQRGIGDFKRKFGGRLDPVFRGRLRTSSPSWRAVGVLTELSGRRAT